MIVSSLKHKIKGLDELFKYLPQNYNFYDAGLVSMNWDVEKEVLTVTYSCYYGIDKDSQHRGVALPPPFIILFLFISSYFYRLLFIFLY